MHGKHKHHIILWEREDGDAYLHCDPKDLTPEFLEKLRNDVEGKLGWKRFRKIMKEKGYPIE